MTVWGEHLVVNVKGASHNKDGCCITAFLFGRVVVGHTLIHSPDSVFGTKIIRCLLKYIIQTEIMSTRCYTWVMYKQNCRARILWEVLVSTNIKLTMVRTKKTMTSCMDLDDILVGYFAEWPGTKHIWNPLVFPYVFQCLWYWGPKHLGFILLFY